MKDTLPVSEFTESSVTLNINRRPSRFFTSDPYLSKNCIKTKYRRKQGKKQDKWGTTNNLKAAGFKGKNRRRILKPNIKTLVNLFLEQSSLHSLKQIGNSFTARRKIVWTFIFVIGIVGCVVQVGQFFTAYFKYPVVVNKDSSSPSQQDFPAVTICNLNAVESQYLPCLEKGSNELCLSDSVELEPETDLRNTSEPLCAEAPLLLSNTTEKDLQFLRKMVSLKYDSKVAYGHKAKDFIRYCKFYSNNCTYTDFLLSVSHASGNCYTFNAVQDKEYRFATDSGPLNGLELELDLEVDKYTEYANSIGALVQIHSPYLYHNIEDEGIVISPGFKTFIGLSKHASVRLPPPYKDHCREYALNETRTLCYHQCFNGISFSVCRCVVYQIKARPGVRKCDWKNVHDVCCIFQLKAFKLNDCDCPLPCTETTYNLQISYAQWPSKAYYMANKFNFVKENKGNLSILTLREVRKTRLRLKVFFDTLDYTVYQQSPMYHSSEVLNQIGSQMGLWLGLSLIAIFECIENFIALCRMRMTAR